MKFVGGKMHGKDVPAWAQDGRSMLDVVETGGDGTTFTRVCYILKEWRHPDGCSTLFFADGRMDEKDVEQAALEFFTAGDVSEEMKPRCLDGRCVGYWTDSFQAAMIQHPAVINAAIKHAAVLKVASTFPDQAT